MSGGLLVAGTTSDAGKSLLTAGICRWLVRQGVRVAPFKAQNMSLNSWVTADGAEIGRAQAVQAAAARVDAEAAMNPVLLKPGSDRHSQVVLMGRPVAEVDALSYRAHKPRLLTVALEALERLRARFDVVVCEGAGSPAEINLRENDIANMGLARAAALPVVVVGDIDRGGVFAGLFGTLALLSPEDQALVAGFLVNKFRGDPTLLAPGLDMLQGLTGRPVMGVVPWTGGLQLDLEDSLGLDAPRASSGPPVGPDELRVAVVRLPRISNATDVDALACEPGVVVSLVDTPQQVLDADLVVVPGTRSTVRDLAWLRSRGLDDAMRTRAEKGLPVLGICGGYQMLGSTIDDPVESAAGVVQGLGLLPVRTEFRREKTLRRPVGAAADGSPVHGYEIHHGVLAAEGGEPLFTEPDGTPEGCRSGAVWGTVWHGSLENDAYRRGFLRAVADLAGRRFVPAGDVSFPALREARLDVLGDLVEQHCDTAALWRLIESGPPAGLPFVPPGAPEVPASEKVRP
ncbi:adenosylcobyric acid synthase (glutamine-hydrolysing) [Motilibacter rhizosphaerae]|uniref:Cobyric acid synthase n=1 Tax=Motilibacter rhizosphaerae TaxID=598652 RepID=A0A4Q7NS16_9ACTN|nr:cobyric acid synthase [Motilibacter rhizosphaerae]RZS89871.1 adenosylcobyric acid synthase (glutamine-hydrolysing) [Motilibacter rhizosphaerae]